jgi:hypothetical protein
MKDTFNTGVIDKLKIVNWILFVIGITSVYFITRNWWAVLFCFIASIHLGIKDIEKYTYMQGYVDALEGKPGQVINLVRKQK